MIGIRDCPCKDCTDRYPSCHSSCDNYIGWRQELDEKNEIIKEDKEQRRLLYSPTGSRRKKK